MLKGGAREAHGALRPSLKRIFSEGALAGGLRGPSLAPARRRAPRSHPLPRLASDASLDSLASATTPVSLQARPVKVCIITSELGAWGSRCRTRCRA